MNVPSSCFWAAVNASARAGADDRAATASAQAKPKAAVSFMPNSK